jgi:hydroxymethylbilane synthase
MERPLRLGTRGSPLALWQANMVAHALCDAHGWRRERIEIVPIRTTGDKVQDRALAEIGGKALWTKELDRALLEHEIDFAVHSMKDVETIRPPDIAIAAMPPRADVRDRLIGADSLAALPPDPRVGTSSPRRAAQVRRARPDADILLFRGNVDTRLRKLAEGEADATLLAAAGLERLGRNDVGVALDGLLPAPAQGAVGVEARADDRAMLDLLAAIDHAPTSLCVRAERALLAALGADCRAPVAALAQLESGRVLLRAEILSEDGRDYEAGELLFMPADVQAPARLAQALLDRAAPPVRQLFAG